MGWTEQQQQTIDVRGRNVLVAAAAGSGKTTVLVERIRKMVTEENVPIDSMLIVTFTNAAAAEMKEKIRRSLREKAEEFPERQELREQLECLPGASISTFHSFALNVIRNFFYLIDLDPDLSICDESQGLVLLEEALDDLLEECYESGDPEFHRFLDWYGSERSDDKVRDILKEVYRNLLSLPDPFGTLNEAVEELQLSPEGYRESRAIRRYRTIVQEGFVKAAEDFRSASETLGDAGLDRMAQLISPDADLAEDLAQLTAEGRYQEASERLKEHGYARMAAKKDEKEEYDLIKTRIQSLRDRGKKRLANLGKTFLDTDEDGQIARVLETAPVAKTLQKLVERMHQIFTQKKRENKKLDFNDIEHLCLKILENEDAADFYQKKFLHIFVDEYQDTSILQETILGRISRDNNLFMVGDIKQSIYKFRLAEPEIFQSRYERYRSGEDERSMKIDLNRNFRSKPVILETINNMFRPVMKGYDADACLYPGIPYDGEYSFPPKLVLIDTQGKEDADEAIRDLKDAELEALEVCRLIEQNLGRPYYDSKAGKVSHLRYRDMVILMRSVANYAGVYTQMMKQYGIPLFVDDNDGYFDTMEINVFLNLLRIIDNKYQDVPLISVLRSEVFRFSTDELAQIRVDEPDGSYAEAFLHTAEKGEGPLGERCAKAAADLSRWKKLSYAMPLPEFVWALMTETNYYLLMGAMPNGLQRQANLRSLVDRTESFSENGQSSLYGFIRYIDQLRSRKNVKTSQVTLLGENEDVVRIMTIHKSKGLEFPMVIAAGMGRKLNYTKGGSRVAFHKDIGLGLYYEDPEKHIEMPTLPCHVIRDQIRREEVEENIRVLYVALTRAKDILLMTGTYKNTDKYLEEKAALATGDTTYLAMLEELPEVEVISCEDLLLKAQPQAARTAAKAAPDAPARDAAARLAYEYAYPQAGSIRSKYSVSSLNEKAHQILLNKAGEEGEEPEPDLNPEEEATVIRLAQPHFMDGEKRITAAERGTIYHGIMERIDFGRAEREGMDYLEAAAEDFVKDGIFLEEELAAVDLRNVRNFFCTDLGKRCADAFRRGELFREQPFNLKSRLESEEIIVQGIIDCFFLEGEKAVLLDYKTNWIDPDRPFEQEAERLRGIYGEQIRMYREALTKALGVPVDEAYLYLFSAEREIEIWN